MVGIPLNEEWYVREVIPDPLKWFMYELARRLGLPSVNVGIRGNPKTHFRGGHRSWNFIKYSEYCTNRTYTVSRTLGDRNPVNKDAVSAGDITAPEDKLIWLCKRLDAATRSGNFEGLTEWYGNDDGDNRVDGYDNIANVIASSDASHLWHAHMTFDRGIIYTWAFFRALMDFIFEEEDVALTDEDITKVANKVVQTLLNTAITVPMSPVSPAPSGQRDDDKFGPLTGYDVRRNSDTLIVVRTVQDIVTETKAMVEQLELAGVNPEVIAQRVAELVVPHLPDQLTSAQIAVAVLDEEHRRLAE